MADGKVGLRIQRSAYQTDAQCWPLSHLPIYCQRYSEAASLNIQFSLCPFRSKKLASVYPIHIIDLVLPATHYDIIGRSARLMLSPILL